MQIDACQDGAIRLPDKSYHAWILALGHAQAQEFQPQPSLFMQFWDSLTLEYSGSGSSFLPLNIWVREDNSLFSNYFL